MHVALGRITNQLLSYKTDKNVHLLQSAAPLTHFTPLYGKKDADGSNPYAFGMGKRSAYNFGLGKRAEQAAYTFGLGRKRDPYAFGLGKRDPASVHLRAGNWQL